MATPHFIENTIRCVTKLNKPVEVREPLQDVLQAAHELRDLFGPALDAQKADGGDKTARDRLARYSAARKDRRGKPTRKT